MGTDYCIGNACSVCPGNGHKCPPDRQKCGNFGIPGRLADTVTLFFRGLQGLVLFMVLDIVYQHSSVHNYVGKKNNWQVPTEICDQGNYYTG